jgi:DMSO/TMAO reductase YedYZ molybdopterin-dependent catalytic subunit
MLWPLLVQAAGFDLVVKGESKALNLSLAEIEAMPRTKLAVKDRDGATNTFDGVLLHEILLQVEAPHGELLRGEALTLSVVVRAKDGYAVVFSLAELDPLFTDRRVLLAFRRDGEALDSHSGPLRLVIPEEKRRGRWVRQVTELQIVKTSIGTRP